VNWHLLDSGANTSVDGSLGPARKPHPAQGAVAGLCLPVSHVSRPAAWWRPARLTSRWRAGLAGGLPVAYAAQEGTFSSVLWQKSV
jgi:hypothetical protein